MPRSSEGNACFPTLKPNRNLLFAALKHSSLLLLLLACAAECHAHPSIWIQSPKPGPNPNQVLVYATATSPDGISGWAIYLDDVVAYQVASNSLTLSYPLTLTNGRHLLYARVWDQKSFGTSATLLLEVSQTPPPPIPIPTPPSNAQVLTEMQNTMEDWSDCSLCAEGTHHSTNYWTVPFQGEPSLSGSSRELFLGGLPWTNALFIKTMPQTSNVSNYLWDFWVYHDSVSAANIWAAEFDLYHFLGGREFMIGSQCAFGDGYWDTWDSANNRWILSGIRCPRWAPDTWHHIQWYTQRVDDMHYRYNTLVVDGKPYAINQTWKMNPTIWPDAIGIQYQLDQDASGTSIYQWIDHVTLTVW